MAWRAIDGGEYGRARALLAEALAASRELSAWSATARQLAPLGLIARLEADYPAAWAHFREALATSERIGDRGMMARVVIDLAGLSAVAGQPRRAARLWGATESWRARATAAHETDRGYEARYQCDLAVARAALGEPAFAAAWAGGQALSLDQVVAEALAEPSADGDAGPSAAPAASPAGTPTGGPTPLTVREGEVAALVARGLSNRQIAAELSISRRTVSTHLTHVMAKLGLDGRVQVATWAVARGLGAPPAGR
jgi:non-specific serine/threonine protein kinase